MFSNVTCTEVKLKRIGISFGWLGRAHFNDSGNQQNEDYLEEAGGCVERCEGAHQRGHMEATLCVDLSLPSLMFVRVLQEPGSGLQLVQTQRDNVPQDGSHITQL